MAKMTALCYNFLLITAICVIKEVKCAGEPHIIIIIADDLGWNDVSYHGSSQIMTPNIDCLAYNGIILNSHYVQPSGSATRAALLTGKYPIKLGMQGESIKPGVPVGLPDGKILPEYLKDIGYATHFVGKWNLGQSRWNDTPTHRGFDHHFGFFNGWTSYYDYLTTVTVNGKEYTGFDLRRDTQPAWDLSGQYATDIFTTYATDTIQQHDVARPLFMVISHLAAHAANPSKSLEAPQESIDKFGHIIDSGRRTYAGMVSKIDDSVGAIVSSLEQKGIFDNTVILFISDGGAASVGEIGNRNFGSNYPFKGIKGSLWEGGVRSVAFISSQLFLQRGRVSTDLIHVTDWLPTILSAANSEVNLFDLDIDGVDLWSSLNYNFDTTRRSTLINIDEKNRNAALILSSFKLIVGSTLNGSYDDYFGESGEENLQPISYNSSAVFNSLVGQTITKLSYQPTNEFEYESLRNLATIKCEGSDGKHPCDLSDGGICLFNLAKDPCEQDNMINMLPSLVRQMKRKIVEYREGLIEQFEMIPNIEESDPKKFQYAWNPWKECVDALCTA
ncbi:arylsulfatase B-like [Onthophagus taurus]|uniref:arylsulfatase B-like n=1 Tax=Onthophagus taurus TaxID=166361 RepID=UPI000C1FE764|nr:arylsulfatase B-like [Onthophagus taurus]